MEEMANWLTVTVRLQTQMITSHPAQVKLAEIHFWQELVKSTDRMGRHGGRKNWPAWWTYSKGGHTGRIWREVEKHAGKVEIQDCAAWWTGRLGRLEEWKNHPASQTTHNGWDVQDELEEKVGKKYGQREGRQAKQTDKINERSQRKVGGWWVEYKKAFCVNIPQS